MPQDPLVLKLQILEDQLNEARDALSNAVILARELHGALEAERRGYQPPPWSKSSVQHFTVEKPYGEGEEQ